MSILSCCLHCFVNLGLLMPEVFTKVPEADFVPHHTVNIWCFVGHIYSERPPAPLVPSPCYCLSDYTFSATVSCGNPTPNPDSVTRCDLRAEQDLSQPPPSFNDGTQKRDCFSLCFFSA